MQPTLIVSTGLNGRSGAQSVNIRPVNSVNFNSNYFLPAKMGGDHAFKFGGYWRDALQPRSISAHRRLRDRALPDRRLRPTTASTRRRPAAQVDLTRDGYSIYDLTERLRLRAGHDHARPR